MASNKKMKKNAVVFGGSGFLGNYVVTELADRGWKVRIADIKKPPEGLLYDDFLECDLTDKSTIDKVIPKNTNVVYNFAGMSDLDEAINKPYTTMELNVMEIGRAHV